MEIRSIEFFVVLVTLILAYPSNCFSRDALKVGESRHELGLRVDCANDYNVSRGDRQPCVKVTGLALKFEHRPAEALHSWIRLDPFGSPDSTDATRPDSESRRYAETTAIALVDDFAFAWAPRSNLIISVEDYSGATGIPNTSGLSRAAPYGKQGWDQLALTLKMAMPLLAGTDVKLAAGNGEGELHSNLDPQQYFGIEVGSQVVSGLWLRLGLSVDGNNTGSEEYLWNIGRMNEECGLNLVPAAEGSGFSATRMGTGIEMDGRFAAMPGFKAGLGWQRSTFADLNKDRGSFPSQDEYTKCKFVRPEYVFLEDESGGTARRTRHSVYGFNASYLVLSRYTLGFDYQTRVVDKGQEKYISIRDKFVGSSAEGETEETSKIVQSAISFGLGIDLSQELDLLLEYSSEAFDNVYTQAAYVKRNGDLSQSSKMFNVRISYNWD